MSTGIMVSETDRLKARLKTMWMAGDYDRFSRYMESGAREFYERLGLAPGCRVLDVGCGSGQVALIAAKDGLGVTGVDIASNLIARARARAQAEGLEVRFEQGDAESLSFEDGSFDAVVSLIGAMFAPRPEVVAGELLRVCVPGAPSRWAIGRRKGSSGRCSRRFRSSLHHPECPHRCCGAKKPWSRSGSALDSPTCPSRGACIPSAIRFLRRRWWKSFVATMARPTRRSPLWMRKVESACAKNSKRCGRCITGPTANALRCLPNIWRWSAFEFEVSGESGAMEPEVVESVLAAEALPDGRGIIHGTHAATGF